MKMSHRTLIGFFVLCLLLTVCSPAGNQPSLGENSSGNVLEPQLPEGFGSYIMARHGGNYMYNYYLPPSPSSTPWSPSWSPDGSAIAVSMAGSIWSVDPSTGTATEMTRGSKYHSSPSWSPDGQWIVYTADDGGSTIQLEILNVTSGVATTLTEDDYVYTDPVFSPDGTKLAYVSTAPNGYFNVYVRAISNGVWNGAEVAVSSDNDYGRSRLYFGNQDMHITPSWLPNGNELLLVSNRNVALGSGNVIRVPAVENGISQLTTVLAEQTLYRTQPDVSIDGKRFIYSSTSGTADQFNNLYVQPTVGGEPYKMTFFQHDAFHPRWSPDGEWIAFISNEGGLPQLELLETYGGERRKIQITERIWKEPMGTLKMNINLSGNSDLTPARISLMASDGKYYSPNDAYARVAQQGGFGLFHTEGNFEVTLPTGLADVTISKGFEIYPARQQIEINPNETTEVNVTLQRMTDLSANGWHNGSTHVHTNYAGNLHNTLENMMMMSDAEDQDIVAELIANKDNRILDYQFFIPGGDAHPLSTEERVLIVGEEYRPPFYGHVFMLGLDDHLISPFTTGYEGTAIESLYPSNTDMFRKAKTQGATTGYVHAFSGNADPLNQGLGGGKGFMVDAILGTTDAVEWSQANNGGFYPLYAAWNNDIRVTAVGGEDAISSLHWTALVGAMRTYIRPDDGQRTMGGWLTGLREGHAFITNGPLLSFTANGNIPGETVTMNAETETLSIAAGINSITPVTRAWLVHNGEDIAEVPLSENRMSGKLETEIPITKSGWIHLRAEGVPGEHFPLDARYAQAFTNPVWISVGNQPIRNKASADYGVQWIDQLTEMALEWPGWRSQEEIDHVLGQFQQARDMYEQLGVEAEEGN